MCQGDPSKTHQSPALTHEQDASPCKDTSSSPFLPRNADENEELSDYLTLHDIQSSWTGVLMKPTPWHNSSGIGCYTICHTQCNICVIQCFS